MAWEHDTGSGRDEYVLRFGDNKVTVHRHRDHPTDEWCVTCFDLAIVNRNVGKVSPEAAMEKAEELVEAELMGMLEAFEAARSK